MWYNFQDMKRLLFSLVIVFSLFATPLQVSAQTTEEWSAIDPECVDTKFKGERSGETDGVATLKGFGCLLVNTLTVGTSIVGLSAFIMIIVGSFLYLTSGGNAKGTEAAQKTITAAIAGVAVSVAGIVVLNFISSFTGVDSIFTLDLDADTAVTAPADPPARDE
jgi:hypothetical protein